MADITPYKSKVLPSGKLTTSANPYDFGAQVAQGLAQVANATDQMAAAEVNRGRAFESAATSAANVSNAIYRLQEEDEITSIHTKMAELRAQGQERVAGMASEAVPGDKTFIQRVGDSFNGDFDNISKGLSTPKAQQLFQSEAANMKSQFMQHAVGVQVGLEKEFAVNQAKSITDNLSKVVSNDETQLGSVIDQFNKSVDDPNGRFARLEAPVKEKYKQEAVETFKMAAAMGLVRRNPGAILDNLDPAIQDKIKQANANPAAPGEIPDLNADHVKPYSNGQVQAMSRRIDAPTKYDAWINEAARKEGIDPRELKLRISAESNFDPNAKSDQGALGIMQMTPETAARYGVNPNDPRDAIFGGAKMLADYIRKSGGDMSKVDMMYYGGESGKGWGPNTKQYAANLSAVRQAAGLASTSSPENFAPGAADKLGEALGGKKIDTKNPFLNDLPADKQYAILTHARAMQNAREQDEAQAQVKRNADVKMQSEALQSNFLQRMTDPNAKGGVPTMQEIAQASVNGVMSPDDAIKMQNVLYHVQNEQNAMNKKHPEQFNDFVKRIYAPDGAQDKIYNENDLYKALSADNLSGQEFIQLRNYLYEHKNGVSASVGRYMTQAMTEAEKTLRANVSIGAAELSSPGTVAAISNQFFTHMEDKIEEYRKANKDPMDLFRNPKDPNYFYNPKLLQTFMPSDITGQTASKVVMNEAANMPTYKDYDKLKSGETFTDPNGNIRRKP